MSLRALLGAPRALLQAAEYGFRPQTVASSLAAAVSHQGWLHQPSSSVPGTPLAALQHRTKTDRSRWIEVVLLQDVEGVGKRGDVRTVNPGFMRHQLFPQGKAVYATEENKAEYALSEAERAALEDSSEAQAKRLERLLDTLSRAHVFVSRRCGAVKNESDRMYGKGVGPRDISQAVAEQLYIGLHQSQVLLPEPVTVFGQFKVPLNLRTRDNRQVELTVNINKVRSKTRSAMHVKRALWQAAQEATSAAGQQQASA